MPLWLTQRTWREKRCCIHYPPRLPFIILMWAASLSTSSPTWSERVERKSWAGKKNWCGKLPGSRLRMALALMRREEINIMIFTQHLNWAHESLTAYIARSTPHISMIIIFSVRSRRLQFAWWLLWAKVYPWSTCSHFHKTRYTISCLHGTWYMESHRTVDSAQSVQDDENNWRRKLDFCIFVVVTFFFFFFHSMFIRSRQV